MPDYVEPIFHSYKEINFKQLEEKNREDDNNRASCWWEFLQRNLR